MIRKNSKGQYCVYNHTGKKKLGCHSSKVDALRQLAAIEISKARRRKK